MVFVQCCREVAEKYPDIKYEEVVIDNCCMMVYTSLSLLMLAIQQEYTSGFKYVSDGSLCPLPYK